MLDNMLVAHMHQPDSGMGKVVVGIAEAYNAEGANENS